MHWAGAALAQHARCGQAILPTTPVVYHFIMSPNKYSNEAEPRQAVMAGHCSGSPVPAFWQVLLQHMERSSQPRAALNARETPSDISPLSGHPAPYGALRLDSLRGALCSTTDVSRRLDLFFMKVLQESIPVYKAFPEDRREFGECFLLFCLKLYSLLWKAPD